MTMELDTILCGDSLNVLKALPESSVHCCVTSPPYYGLRDYGMDAQIGREATPEEYISRRESRSWRPFQPTPSARRVTPTGGTKDPQKSHFNPHPPQGG